MTAFTRVKASWTFFALLLTAMSAADSRAGAGLLNPKSEHSSDWVSQRRHSEDQHHRAVDCIDPALCRNAEWKQCDLGAAA